MDKNELILEMADAFDNRTNPLDHWFLSEHNVSFDDAMSYSIMIGSLLRAYASLPQKVALTLLAIGSVEGVTGKQVNAAHLLSEALYASTMERLKD